jgi:hypothetical protein
VIGECVYTMEVEFEQQNLIPSPHSILLSGGGNLKKQTTTDVFISNQMELCNSTQYLVPLSSIMFNVINVCNSIAVNINK